MKAVTVGSFQKAAESSTDSKSGSGHVSEPSYRALPCLFRAYSPTCRAASIITKSLEENVRAAADREVTEARRTLAVEKERLAREAAEHHESAMAETQRLVAEAEQRATSAEERGRQATQQATQYREQSQTEADALLQRARREAEQIVSSAQKQAESISSTGTAEAERELAAVRAEVERLQKRRDGITAQLSSLADIVSGFGKDEPEAASDEPENDES